MNELLTYINSLEDPIGKAIISWIFIIFWIGVINYIVHIALQWGWEWFNLYRIKNYIKINHGLGDISTDLLDKLRTPKFARFSIIYRRIRDLVQIKQNGGQIDNDALGDIHAGESSRKAALSSYILGILIILGLIGTLRGLITAIVEVQPLLQDIQDIDQFPKISEALRETLAGMETAFVTTLAGLLTSIGLGFGGWLFNLSNSAFLTRFERFVSIEIIPHFTQAPESAIESVVEELTECTETLKLASQNIVRSMQQAVQLLTDSSWGGHLEQQYVLAINFGETSKNLLESLEGIKEHQALIENTVGSFKNMTGESMSQISVFQSTVETFKESTKETVEAFKESIAQSISQISGYQEALREGLEDAVPKLKNESEELKATIRAAHNSQARFVDEIANTLQKRLQSIADNQQVMVQELQQLAGELKIRTALEKQNQVFEGIKTQLIDNQNETAGILSQLKDDLQVQDVIEAQNKVFGRIEAHLGGQGTLVAEQKEVMQTLNTSVKQLQQTFSKAESDEQQRTEKMLQQISLNFVTLSEKMETLNNTMSRPGLYRWGSEIRRWFGFFGKSSL